MASTGAPVKNSEKLSTSSVAELTMTFKSRRRGSRFFR